MSGGGGASASASASFEQHPKRRPPAPGPSDQQQQRKLLKLSVQEDDVAAGVVPPVTVVLDGRCICHRVHLSQHTGFRSLAGALRRMFVDTDADDDGEDHGLDLSNAVPGHVVAYEDMEDDLLLAGDLNWKDFVRVAKRIRIIPVKPSRRRKQCGGLNN
ncbi:auxin-responsive protein IAA33-like [Phragmites australis]|uniref:auxin-responsive protein IAA33-like n=1 Tax=Phragmites australis TaxID=29695 RepID=UPI002D797040|nr:auxin-responsive protein IAA33-like [Phragmites australis]